MTDSIQIRGAKTHNLKNISVDIPRNQLVVITGLSGSGKSSLAFDTLYAEGQRRYVESLSAYARQFLGRMQKPEVDFIDGIPPAIAIEQKVASNNPRSTVGTSTEIYDYLKLFYARIGQTISPVSGEIVKKHTIKDVVDYVKQQAEGTKLMLVAPITRTDNLAAQLSVWLQQGFTRLLIRQHSEVVRISDCLNDTALLTSLTDSPSFLLIDRIVVDREKSTYNRFADSVQTAFYEGHGELAIVIDKNLTTFSERYEADGIQFLEPSEHLFDFNNPLGACPECKGFGNVIGIDPNLVIPDKSLSIYEEAIACWRGEKMRLWQQELVLNAHLFNFPIHTPYCELTEEQQHLLWTGNEYFHGLHDFFRMLEKEQYAKIQYRVMLSRFRGKTLCPTCHGGRLRKEAEYVKVGDKNIVELTRMPIDQLSAWFRSLSLTPTQAAITKHLRQEIESRLRFMEEVGLSYLTLSRLSSTLSGGESQRINLAKSLGSSLVGSLYVLDEPSIGLHPRDTQQLIKVLKELRDLGNTIVVVEHDEEIMRAADYIIDIGPGAGRHGGEVVWSGNFNNYLQALRQHTLTTPVQHSYTLDYLTGRETIDIPSHRRYWNDYIELVGATENNLKNITVRFPLNALTVVTGVSGSGKSSLVSRVLYPALCRHFDITTEYNGSYHSLNGALSKISAVEFVDQNPLSKSTRSNPVTYLKVYDDIRRLFAEQQLSKQMGYTPAHFSFNTPGGRCEECQGEGKITIPMQFMADIIMECEHCHGKRFKNDILEVEYRGNSIYDILEMTVNQAIEFFSQDPSSLTQRIAKRLQTLQDVGIGYIKLGQSSATLSGGESQRVKLAYFLAQEQQKATLFIFDEPTTGLHFHDIKVLLKAINALIDRGNSVIIIEHNTSVIMAADYVIDLGPEGGEKGGQLVFAGTPEQLILQNDSHTGQCLRQINTNH